MWRSRLPLLTVFVLTIAAQTPDTATINGHVVDQTHAGVAGVDVTVRNALTGLERKARTDDVGAFAVSGLPVAGEYAISAAKQGFTNTDLNGVALKGGTTAAITLQLNVAAGQTEITVTGVVGE